MSVKGSELILCLGLFCFWYALVDLFNPIHGELLWFRPADSQADLTFSNNILQLLDL